MTDSTKDREKVARVDADRREKLAKEREKNEMKAEKKVTENIEKAAHAGAHRDPISGEPGAHPIGTGIGAAGGGLAGAVGGAAAGIAGGAAIGTATAGPIGLAVGGVIGAVVGGLAGKEVAESVNPTAEDAYWRDNYIHRPYVSRDVVYEIYRPAYRIGWEARDRYNDRQWDDIEADLESDWIAAHPESSLSWDDARPAARDAWDRVTK